MKYTETAENAAGNVTLSSAYTMHTVSQNFNSTHFATEIFQLHDTNIMCPQKSTSVAFIDQSHATNDVLHFSTNNF